MPTASIETNIDDPPALTNGSGRPLLGSTPVTTLMLASACAASSVVRPRARNEP